MKKFISLFTRNWGLKLLALILALVAFYGIRGSFRGRRVGGEAQHFFMKGTPRAVPAQ